MSHIWVNLVLHTNESYPTYERIVFHVRIRHISRRNESSRISTSIVNLWKSHVTHPLQFLLGLPVNRTCKKRIRHISRRNESSQISTCIVNLWKSHVTHPLLFLLGLPVNGTSSLNPSYLTEEWVISNINEYCQPIKESCHVPPSNFSWPASGSGFT